MPVEHARGLFKLSEALVQNSSTNDNEDDDNEEEAHGLRDEAETYLLRRDKSATQFGTKMPMIDGYRFFGDKESMRKPRS